MAIHIQSFTILHFPSLMIAMSKPAYLAIQEYSPSKPGILTHCSADDKSGFFLNIRLSDLQPQSIYTSSARARLGRRTIPISLHKYDADDPPPRINGAGHENESASGLEYNSPKKKKTPKTCPPPLLVRESGKAVHLANRVVPIILLQVGEPKRFNCRIKMMTGLIPMFPLHDTRVAMGR